MHIHSPAVAVTAQLVSEDPRCERSIARFLAMIPAHLRPTPESVQEVEQSKHPTSKAHRRARRPQVPPNVEQVPSPSSAAEYYATPPAPRVLASYASEEEVRCGRRLSRGALRLWQLLHQLALEASRARAYTVTPRQIVLHLPLATLAGNLNYHEDHVARLGRELERAGLLDCGGHAQRVKGRSMYDRTLWAVLMVSGGEAPRIRAEEWRHNWRPTFEADVEGKTGAAREMSELLCAGADQAEKYEAAKARAVNPGVVGYISPPLPSSDNCDHTSLKAVVQGLSSLWHLHPSKRPRAVGLLASRIARALSEPERRRYWCKVIWQALKAQNEMRGGLQVLGAQLERLEADLREGAPWRNPGAVLAARLKAA